MRAPLAYWLFRCSLLFLTIAPAMAEEEKPAAIVHATPAMWTVHGPKGTAYLLGSFHALPENVDWKTPEIRHAIKTANVFVFEISTQADFLQQWTLLYGANILLPLSVSLPSYFDSQMRSEWRAAVEHTGIDAEALVQLRPWGAARAFEYAMNRENIHIYSEEGVDNKISAIAAERGAPVIGLETADAHLHVMKRDATTTNEIAQLRDAMHKAATMKMQPFGPMLAAWEAGDVKALFATSMQDPAERKIMLDDRNQAWVPKIEKMLTQKRTFLITVGAAHLVGPGGVPNLLRAAGYKVDGPDSPAAVRSAKAD
jgi:uncharacterized protein YbaP (TraB family)